jgi:hypothetical protein
MISTAWDEKALDWQPVEKVFQCEVYLFREEEGGYEVDPTLRTSRGDSLSGSPPRCQRLVWTSHGVR